METRGILRRSLDWAGDFFTLRDLVALAAGTGAVGVLGTVLDWWNTQPTLGRYVLGTAVGLASFAVAGIIWNRFVPRSRRSGPVGETPGLLGNLHADVGLAEAAAHVTGETYRILYRGDPYPADLAEALPIIHQHTKHLKPGPPAYLDFVFSVFNAYPFDVSVVGQLEGIVRVKRGGNVEPFARLPILIERFDNRPYLHKGRIVIRQHLEDAELEYVRHEIPQEQQAFDFQAVRVWCATSDPRRADERFRLRLGYADMPAGLREWPESSG